MRRTLVMTGDFNLSNIKAHNLITTFSENRETIIWSYLIYKIIGYINYYKRTLNNIS